MYILYYIHIKKLQDLHMSTQIVNISLPRELVRKIDSAARGSYASRSEYIRQAVVSRLRAQELDVWGALEAASDEIGAEARSRGYATDEDFVQAVKAVRKEDRKK